MTTSSVDLNPSNSVSQSRINAPYMNIWAWATITAAAALFFPKIEGIRNHGHSAWGLLYFFVPLDLEGAIIIPPLIAITFVLFRYLGGWALRDANVQNRPARTGLVTGVLGIVGIIAFWVSAPIVLGGLAIMLGLVGRRLAAVEGRGVESSVAITLGVTAATAGAIMWSFIT
jgi:hypothetical protein